MAALFKGSSNVLVFVLVALVMAVVAGTGKAVAERLPTPFAKLAFEDVVVGDGLAVMKGDKIKVRIATTTGGVSRKGKERERETQTLEDGLTDS